MAENYGVGIGIGEGLSKVGQALQGYADKKSAARDKQAEAFEAQAKDIAANIAQMGGPQAPGAAAYLQQLNSVVARHNALYPMHETPALIARIGKVFGRQPAAPTPDVRAQLTPESMIAAAPRLLPGQKQLDLQSEIAQMDQALATAYPNLEPGQRKQRAFELVAGSRDGSKAKTAVEQMNESAEAYALAHPELPHDQAIAKGRLEYMGQGGTGTAHWVTYVSPDRKTVRMINQNNQTQVDAAIEEGLQPVTSQTRVSATSQYSVKRAPGGRPDTLTINGVTYTANDMDKEETPDNVKQAWATEMKNWQEDMARTDERIKQRQSFQVILQTRAANIASEKMVQQITNQMKLGDVRAAQNLVTDSKKKLDEANELRKAGAQAIQANNVQNDLIFLRQVLTAGRAGRGLNKDDVDRIISGGRPGVRLENVIDEVFGGQQLNPEIRANIVDYVNNEYNSRYANWADNKDALDQAKGSAAPDTGKGKPPTQPTKPRVKYGDLPQ